MMRDKEAKAEVVRRGYEVISYERASQLRHKGFYLIADKVRFADRTVQGVGASYAEAFSNLAPFVRQSHPTT
jgi:hypothetical protein